MARFRDIAKGTAARERTPFTTLDGAEVVCDVRVLLGEDDDTVLEEAAKHARAKGIVNPDDGNAIYDFAKALWTVLLGCVDPDSPVDAPVPFFSDIAEIKRHLDRDRIMLLCERQQSLQATHAPRRRGMSLEQFAAETLRIAGMGDGEELPFERWAPVLRRSYVHFLAVQYVTSLGLNSPSGTASGANTSACTLPGSS